MGSFLGYNDVGVWTSNQERDAFLDWFAEHRCVHGDSRWDFCTSEHHRWMGCGIELSELVPRGETFAVTPAEQAAAAKQFWPAVGALLDIISQITRGEWKHLVGSDEAREWRPGDAGRTAKWQKDQERLRSQPIWASWSSSFGPNEQVKFIRLDDTAK